MRSADEGFLLLARGGRTPHSLPLHPERGDPLEPWVREDLKLLRRVQRSPRRMPMRVAAALAVTVAGALRKGTQMGA